MGTGFPWRKKGSTTWPHADNTRLNVSYFRYEDVGLDVSAARAASARRTVVTCWGRSQQTQWRMVEVGRVGATRVEGRGTLQDRGEDAGHPWRPGSCLVEVEGGDYPEDLNPGEDV